MALYGYGSDIGVTEWVVRSATAGRVLKWGGGGMSQTCGVPFWFHEKKKKGKKKMRHPPPPILSESSPALVSRSPVHPDLWLKQGFRMSPQQKT